MEETFTITEKGRLYLQERKTMKVEIADKLKRVKRQICGETCDGFTALTHWKVKGHNSWQILLPKEVERTEKERLDKLVL